MTLYGPRYGIPITTTSDWPLTSTNCWRCRFASVRSWTASTSPAFTPVTLYEASILRKNSRRTRGGARSLPFFAAIISAWSFTDHSHSRLFRNPSCDGKVSLFTVVSIWKIFTPLAARSLPIRMLESLIAECPGRGSM